MICKRCKENKGAEAFGPNKAMKSGIDSWCRECHRKKSKEWYSQYSKITHQNNRMYKKYGISLEEYGSILENQGRRCSICNKEDSGIEARPQLYVDHNHQTGKIRGLLCDGCNKGLGNFRDNRDYLLKAAEYVTASS